MPQSLASVHIHLVFSTLGRRRFLRAELRDGLDAYLATVLRNLGCQTATARSVDDHAHILFDLPSAGGARKTRTVSTSDAVKTVKASSSKWLKGQTPGLEQFAWQAGYGAFSVSASNLDAVRDYIVRQEEHHRRTSFQDEYRALMQCHGVEYDERYLWE